MAECYVRRPFPGTLLPSGFPIRLGPALTTEGGIRSQEGIRMPPTGGLADQPVIAGVTTYGVN
jgi:hypothetical protein